MGAGNVTLQLHAPLDFPFGEYCHEVVGQVARGTGKDLPKSRAAKAASSERLAMVNGTGCIAMCRVLERGEQTNARTTIFLQVSVNRRVTELLPSSESRG